MEINELQKDLAAAFRWTAKLNMHEGIANHFSVCAPDSNDFIKSLALLSTKTIIGNRQIYASSMGEGKTAVEKQKKSIAVEEIKNLSEQILSEIK